jgi:Rrf2 family protein
MKLSRASTYALHALAVLASREGSDYVSSHDIAFNYGISEHLLEMALKSLVNQGMLESRKGPQSGYRLARPASQMTVLEVVEAVDGPICWTVPTEESDDKPEVSQRLQALCGQVAEDVRNRLQTVTVADLAGKATKRQ